MYIKQKLGIWSWSNQWKASWTRAFDANMVCKIRKYWQMYVENETKK